RDTPPPDLNFLALVDEEDQQAKTVPLDEASTIPGLSKGESLAVPYDQEVFSLHSAPSTDEDETYDDALDARIQQEQYQHGEHLQPQTVHGEHFHLQEMHGEHLQPQEVHGKHLQPQEAHGEHLHLQAGHAKHPVKRIIQRVKDTYGNNSSL